MMMHHFVLRLDCPKLLEKKLQDEKTLKHMSDKATNISTKSEQITTSNQTRKKKAKSRDSEIIQHIRVRKEK